MMKQMTYAEFLTQMLSSKDKLHVPNKGDSYRLEEDLELLLELSRVREEYTLKVFKNIANKGRLRRTAESLKGRFMEQLFRVDQNAILRIEKWLKTEGLHGYLSFEEGEMKLSLTDPKDQKTQKAKVSAQLKRKPTPKVEKQNIPVNCHQLDVVMKAYSRMVDLPIRVLLQKLDALSGDFEMLDDYIENRDESLLWTEEEDEMLRKGGADADLLRKYRGESAERRIAYLGLH